MTQKQIKAAVAALKKQIMQEIARLEVSKERYEQNRLFFAGRLEAIQKQCKHSKVSRQSDPSGGNDSCETCLTCGKELL